MHGQIPYRDSFKSVARFWRSYIPPEEQRVRFEFSYKTQSNTVGFVLQPANQQILTETFEGGRKSSEEENSVELY